MKAARCAPAFCGCKPNDLAAGTASHRLNFLAARLNGTENPPKRPGIRRMPAYTLFYRVNPQSAHGYEEIEILRVLHERRDFSSELPNTGSIEGPDQRGESRARSEPDRSPAPMVGRPGLKHPGFAA